MKTLEEIKQAAQEALLDRRIQDGGNLKASDLQNAYSLIADLAEAVQAAIAPQATTPAPAPTNPTTPEV